MKHPFLIGVTCWMALVPARAAEGVVTYKSLAPDVAFDLAQSALHQCRKDGYQVAVVVSDRFGAPLVALRDRYTPVGAVELFQCLFVLAKLLQSATVVMRGEPIAGVMAEGTFKTR